MKRLIGVVVSLAFVSLSATGVGAIPGRAVTDGGQAIETVLVWNNEPNPTVSEVNLDPRRAYRLFVSGAVNDWTADESGIVDGEKWGVDALYCYAQWRCPTPELWRQLRVQGQGLDEFGGRAGKMRYQKDHKYEVFFTGYEGTLTFTNGDGASTSDNSGRWKVQIIDHGPAKYRAHVSFNQTGTSVSGYTTLAMEGETKVAIKNFDPEVGGGGKILAFKDPKMSLTETIDIQDGSAPTKTKAVFEFVEGTMTWEIGDDYESYYLSMTVRVKRSDMSTCKVGDTATVSFGTIDPYDVFSGCSQDPFRRPDFTTSGYGSTSFPRWVRPDPE